MRNVQITLDEDTLLRVDRAAKPLGLKRSEIVRRRCGCGCEPARSNDSNSNGSPRSKDVLIRANGPTSG